MKLKEKQAREPYNGNADQTSKQDWNYKEELLTYVEETPFAIVKQEEGYFVIMGKYRMSEAIQKREEAYKNAKSITWMRILQVIGATIENYKQEKQ